MRSRRRVHACACVRIYGRAVAPLRGILPRALPVDHPEGPSRVASPRHLPVAFPRVLSPWCGHVPVEWVSPRSVSLQYLPVVSASLGGMSTPWSTHSLRRLTAPAWNKGLFCSPACRARTRARQLRRLAWSMAWCTTSGPSPCPTRRIHILHVKCVETDAQTGGRAP